VFLYLGLDDRSPLLSLGLSWPNDYFNLSPFRGVCIFADSLTLEYLFLPWTMSFLSWFVIVVPLIFTFEISWVLSSLWLVNFLWSIYRHPSAIFDFAHYSLWSYRKCRDWCYYSHWLFIWLNPVRWKDHDSLLRLRLKIDQWPSYSIIYSPVIS